MWLILWTLHDRNIHSWHRVWQELAKFRHFGKIIKVRDNTLKAYLVFWQNSEPTSANFVDHCANFNRREWPNYEIQSSHLALGSFWLEVCPENDSRVVICDGRARLRLVTGRSALSLWATLPVSEFSTRSRKCRCRAAEKCFKMSSEKKYLEIFSPVSQNS